MILKDAYNEIFNYDHHKNILNESIGDGYLYQHNPLFRRVRDITLQSGFQFDLNNHPNYFISPVMSLDWILKHSTIPYRDNRSSFKLYCEKYPTSILSDLIGGLEPRHSHVLHESTHSYSQKYMEKLFYNKPDNRQKVIMSIMIEALAQSTDFLINIYAENEIHYWCLIMNHNWQLNQNQKKNLQALIRDIGLVKTHKILYFFMIYANFQYQWARKIDLEEIITNTNILFDYDKHWVSIENFYQSAIQMDPLFRFEATRNYFLSNGRIKLYLNLIEKCSPLEIHQEISQTLDVTLLIEKLCGGLVYE